MGEDVFAQQGSIDTDKHHFTQNWYAEGAFSNQWLWIGNVNKGIAFGGRAGVGTWFDKYSGARLTIGYGNRKTDMEFCNSYYQIGLDYTFNLLALGRHYDEKNRFSFNVNIGPAFYGLKHSEEGKTIVNRFAVNAGINAGYDCTPHFGVFTEISFNGMEKYYYGYTGISIKSELLIGVRYRFNRHDYTHKVSGTDYTPQFEQLNSRITEMNDEINSLRKQLEESKLMKEDSVENHTVMLAPKSEESSIDIYFDKFSSFLSEEQRQKIDVVGEWMKNNELDINIVAFSDNIDDKSTDEALRNGRTEAISKLLVEEYGIAPTRITIIPAEKIGYKNITGCNAKILFVEPKK